MKTYLHVLNYCYLQVNRKQVLPPHQPLQQAQLPHQRWFGIQVQLARSDIYRGTVVAFYGHMTQEKLSLVTRVGLNLNVNPLTSYR